MVAERFKDMANLQLMLPTIAKLHIKADIHSFL